MLSARVFVADGFHIGVRVGLLAPYKQTIKRVDIGFGTGNDRVGVSGLARCNAPFLFHADTHGGLCVGAFCHRVHLIKLKARVVREECLDRIEGGVDGAVTGSPPGTVHRVPASQIEELAEPAALSSHALRWDHALAVARWLLGDEHPDRISVFLVEIAHTGHGADLSDAVAEAVQVVADEIRRTFTATGGSDGHCSGRRALQPG